MSTTKFWLRRLIRNRTWTGAALALALAYSAPSVFGVLWSPARTQPKATVRTDKARILVSGFHPDETRTIKVAGREQEPLTAVTDSNGNLSTQLTLPADNTDAVAFNVEVAWTVSTVTVSAATIADSFVVSDQLNGQPAVNDTPAQAT